MANNHSISNNPIFQNCDQPFTELFELLPKLQRNISGNSMGYSTDTNTLKAIYQHTDNAMTTLLIGIQSLGGLLAAAADNKDMGLSLSDVTYIGWLFQALGNMVFGCNITKENLSEELHRRGTSDF